MAKKKEAKTREIRVLFREPPDYGPGASVWVDAADTEAGLTITLQHDYKDDLKPAQGWRVEHDGKTYEVRRVAGKSLELAQVKEGGE